MGVTLCIITVVYARHKGDVMCFSAAVRAEFKAFQNLFPKSRLSIKDFFELYLRRKNKPKPVLRTPKAMDAQFAKSHAQDLAEIRALIEEFDAAQKVDGGERQTETCEIERLQSHRIGAPDERLRRRKRQKRKTKAEVMVALRESTWALVLPVIVVFGLKFGIFTPTEAAVVAAVYATLISLFVYKELNVRKMYPLFVSAAKTSAVVMFLVAAAMVSAWLITVAQIPGQVVALLQPLLDSPRLMMLAIMVLVMVVGTALDMTPTILLLTPVLMPVVKAAGIDPVYFGVLFVINNAIGLITPPVGTVLNTVAGVGKISMDEVTRGVLPFMWAQFAIMFLMVAFPQIVMVPARWFY